MIIVLGIIFAFVSFCIVALVLLQESKGGGIAAMGVSGMDNLVGARNPLRKLTVIFSIIFLLIVMGINIILSRNAREEIPAALDEPPAITEGEESADTTSTETDATGIGEEDLADTETPDTTVTEDAEKAAESVAGKVTEETATEDNNAGAENQDTEGPEETGDTEDN